MNQGRPTHFNAAERVCKNMFCDTCAHRFYEQTARFIELNTGAITKLKRVADSETVDEAETADFISGTKDILSIVHHFNSINENNRVLDKWGAADDAKFFEDALYPITRAMLKNSLFSEYIEAAFYDAEKYPTHLTYDQITEFYQYAMHENALREDIQLGCLTVYADDVEDYEETFDTPLPFGFPRRKERTVYVPKEDGEEGEVEEIVLDLEEFLEDNDYQPFTENYYNQKESGLNPDLSAYHTTYSDMKCVLLNFFDASYCGFCCARYPYFMCASENYYLSSSAFAILLNLLSRQNFYKIIHSKRFLKFRDVLESKINEINRETPVFSNKWKGLPYYCDRIGIRPDEVSLAGVDASHYAFRKRICFDDYICGHPLASDGWFAETRREFEALMAEQEEED
jgi:hypothetical protein